MSVFYLSVYPKVVVWWLIFVLGVLHFRQYVEIYYTNWKEKMLSMFLIHVNLITPDQLRKLLIEFMLNFIHTYTYTEILPIKYEVKVQISSLQAFFVCRKVLH